MEAIDRKKCSIKYCGMFFNNLCNKIQVLYSFQASIMQDLSDSDSKAQTIIDAGEEDDNFLKLQIYYEELNYESLTENPNYAVSAIMLAVVSAF